MYNQRVSVRVSLLSTRTSISGDITGTYYVGNAVDMSRSVRLCVHSHLVLLQLICRDYVYFSDDKNAVHQSDWLPNFFVLRQPLKH